MNFKSAITSFEDFLLKTPLYKKFHSDYSQIRELINFKGPIDAYCTECGKERVFKVFSTSKVFSSRGGGGPSVISSTPPPPPNLFQLKFLCSNDGKHIIYFEFFQHDDKVQKIGQYPSLADLQKSEIKKYHKVLGHLSQEFNKAVGLASHGIGIGSFVYLRRIFENLLEDAHKLATKNSDWDEDKYSNSDMKIKIEILENYLPTFLVENSSIYSILSLGIHELSEEDCLTYFDLLKQSIEIILDQKIEIIEKEKKIKNATKAIQNIHRKLKTENNKKSS